MCEGNQIGKYHKPKLKDQVARSTNTQCFRALPMRQSAPTIWSIFISYWLKIL